MMCKYIVAWFLTTKCLCIRIQSSFTSLWKTNLIVINYNQQIYYFFFSDNTRIPFKDFCDYFDENCVKLFDIKIS